MSYVIFEGEKTVKSVRKKNEKEFFKKAVQKLGLKKDIDFVTFCVSIALRKEYQGVSIEKNSLKPSQKLTGMDAFDKKDIYDLICMEYLNTKENRLKEFETYFYSGFKTLMKWFEDNDADGLSVIERFCEISNYVYNEDE